MNTEGHQGEISEDCKAFLKSIKGQFTENEFSAILKEEVTRVKQNKKWRKEYMFMSVLLRDAEKEAERKGMERGMQKGMEKGMEKGMQKGIEEGMQKGIEEGMQKGIEEGMQKGIEEGMQKGIEEGMQKGIEKGKAEAEKRVNLLIQYLLKDNRIEDLKKSSESLEYQNQLMKEYNIV